MKICVAQIRPVKGDVDANILQHERFLDLAISLGAEMILFPELSITGYEPELAREMATSQDDPRFDRFQDQTNNHQIIAGIGVPTISKNGICISTVIFEPGKPRSTYSKKFIHPDEEKFFTGEENHTDLIGQNNTALAICYELSVPEHAETAFMKGAKFYAASVAKSASGVDNALIRLAYISSFYSMIVVMANCVGPSSGFVSAGQSSVWNDKGELLGQLDDTGEGIILLNTRTREVIIRSLS